MCPRARTPRVEVLPLTPERFGDLVELFGRPGGSIARGCFCMYYRGSSGGAGAASSAANQRALRGLVDRGVVPGLLAYEEGRPVGWISLGPREDYARLQRSPVMKPLDDRPVWSIVCFFVDSRNRGRGITSKLLKAGVAYARSQGAAMLEGYPIDKEERGVADFMWFGAKSTFDQAGFREVARRRPTRPFMRRALKPAPRRRASSDRRGSSSGSPGARPRIR